MIYSPTHSQSYQTGQLAYVANTPPFISCHQSQWTSHREMGHTGPLSREGQKKNTHFVNYLQAIVFDRKDRESHKKMF